MNIDEIVNSPHKSNHKRKMTRNHSVHSQILHQEAGTSTDEEEMNNRETLKKPKEKFRTQRPTSRNEIVDLKINVRESPTAIYNTQHQKNSSLTLDKKLDQQRNQSYKTIQRVALDKTPQRRKQNIYGNHDSALTSLTTLPAIKSGLSVISQQESKSK